MRFCQEALLVCVIFPLSIFAQLPDIFSLTPKELHESKVIAEFPVNTFLENIAVAGNGDLFITSLEDGVVYRIDSRSEKSVFAKIEGKIAGIAFDKKENLLVTGWDKGTTPAVFFVNKFGKVEAVTPLKGAIFLNGIIRLNGENFLIADSYKGVIWLFNAKTKNYAVWLADEKLGRANSQNPFPAVNGLRVFKKNLYATNTERQLMLKIPIAKNGKPASPEIFREKINGDDFALDEKGNLFVTTHVYNNVVKVSATGKVTIIAEGENVVGGTSLAFGRGNSKNKIFVVTNGGMSLPTAKGVQTAKVTVVQIKK